MDKEKIFTISPPLRGEWKFLCPPGHHPNAFDFVQTDKTRKHYHTGYHLGWYLSQVAAKNYWCWEQPVYSPVDGEVVRFADDWPDRESTSLFSTIHIWYQATFRFRPQVVDGRLDIRPNAGNHVMIRAKEGFIVFLAHMKCGSLAVSEGERVQTGQFIGKVGNSGNSTAPHLHINLFDQIVDPYRSRVLPFVFSQYEKLDAKGEWQGCNLSVPDKGAYIRFGQVQLN